MVQTTDMDSSRKKNHSLHRTGCGGGGGLHPVFRRSRGCCRIWRYCPKHADGRFFWLFHYQQSLCTGTVLRPANQPNCSFYVKGSSLAGQGQERQLADDEGPGGTFLWRRPEGARRKNSDTGPKQGNYSGWPGACSPPKTISKYNFLRLIIWQSFKIIYFCNPKVSELAR